MGKLTRCCFSVSPNLRVIYSDKIIKMCYLNLVNLSAVFLLCRFSYPLLDISHVHTAKEISNAAWELRNHLLNLTNMHVNLLNIKQNFALQKLPIPSMAQKLNSFNSPIRFLSAGLVTYRFCRLYNNQLPILFPLLRCSFSLCERE